MRVLVCSLLLIVALCASVGNGLSTHSTKTKKKYTVQLERLLEAPVLTNKFSASDFNYNAAYVPGLQKGNHSTIRDCLAVRAQNYTQGKGNDLRIPPRRLTEYSVNASMEKHEPVLGAGYVSPSSIVIQCETSVDYPFSPVADMVLNASQAPWQALGTEDPRVAYDEKTNTLLMFYTAVNDIVNNATNPTGRVRAMLALATCNVTQDPSCTHWELHGPVFPDTFWSKSGALAIMPEPPHYLLWGDSNICVATSDDLKHFNNTGKCIVEPRADFFDSVLCESGPPPVQLSDGNYLFVYNSARKSKDKTPVPGWDLQYNIGYTIRAKDGFPFEELDRAAEPLLSPTLDWERCDDASGVPGLTPNVVFTEGMKKMKTWPDTWLLYYQGCDSRMGIALVTVTLE